MTEKKRWVDWLRGLCMMAILLDHTELYMTGDNIIPYNMYVVDALVIFFFLSGYLMFKPGGFDLRHKLHSVLRSLLMPYFVFTLLLCLPKAMAHGESLDAVALLRPIVMGQASWFVAALIVAELLFGIVLWVSRERLRGVVPLSLLCFGLSVILSSRGEALPWQLANALQAMLFLCWGYVYHRLEPRMNQWLRPLHILLLFVVLVLVKAYVYRFDISLLVSPIRIDSYPVFLLNVFLVPVVMVWLSQHVPPMRWVEWTGRTSIVYYFFCGAVPMGVSLAFARLGLSYHGHYAVIVLALCCVYALSTLVTWVVYRYLPAITGRAPAKV